MRIWSAVAGFISACTICNLSNSMRWWTSERQEHDGLRPCTEDSLGRGDRAEREERESPGARPAFPFTAGTRSFRSGSAEGDQGPRSSRTLTSPRFFYSHGGSVQWSVE